MDKPCSNILSDFFHFTYLFPLIICTDVTLSKVTFTFRAEYCMHVLKLSLQFQDSSKIFAATVIDELQMMSYNRGECS